MPKHNNFSSLGIEEVLNQLSTSEQGLSSAEVLSRQKHYGLNIIHKRHFNLLTIIIRQFSGNPLILILASATFVSYFLGQHTSSYYIFGMILVSIFLGVWNEWSAEKTVDTLLKRISQTAVVIRNNEKQEIPASHLTVGDIVFLSEGSIVPADMRLLETTRLEINESALTGESKTVFKVVHNEKENITFMGTTVTSGSGRGVVIGIGKETEFGKIAKSATFVKPVTEFQKGLSNFGNLIIRVILLLTAGMFIINVILHHPFLESLLFALAIAVGLTPELLPVIVTISLAHGAGRLSKKHVVAKRLISIENLGNMDILCTDKTGTLTEGTITVVDYKNEKGTKDNHILGLALLCNSAIVHHKVLGNAIDVALWEFALKHQISVDKAKKIHDEPFDYTKKLMFSVVSEKGKTQLIVKGSPDAVLSLSKTKSQTLHKQFQELNKNGYRGIAIATKPIENKKTYSWSDVQKLTYAGYVTFLDTPKKTTKEAIERLHSLNVETKVITGDTELITQKICQEVGLDADRILVGPEMQKLSGKPLYEAVQSTVIFARMTPAQKLQVIQILQQLGHTVGYMGDGINDIPALHSADVGISVNTAVDVAKDAASIVLLQKSLHVVADGIIEGRKTFSNTIKYILMSTSSNFGNMFSAAGASFLLPFLPMTPLQILLTNGLYDISQTTIPSDNVDHESLVKPRHWNIDFIRNYMVFFGPISSLFDFITFGIMIILFKAQGSLFQTGWFVESVATEILVVFIIRTSRSPFFKSRPSNWLLITSLGMVGIGFILPFTPLAKPLGFVAPPPLYFFVITILIALYLILVETVKNRFLKKYGL